MSVFVAFYQQIISVSQTISTISQCMYTVSQMNWRQIETRVTLTWCSLTNSPFQHNYYNLIDMLWWNFNNLHCMASEIQTFTNIYHKTVVANMGKLFTVAYYNMCSKWSAFTRTHARSRTRYCRTARSMTSGRNDATLWENAVYHVRHCWLIWYTRLNSTARPDGLSSSHDHVG